MVIITKGDIFNSRHEVYVDAINCKGSVANGISKKFAKRYPHYKSTYKVAYTAETLEIGSLVIFKVREEDRVKNKNLRYILGLPTKKHWHDESRLEWVEEGIKALKDFCEEEKIKSVALPALGCGLGGLDFEDVKVKIIDVLDDTSTIFYLYEPWENNERPKLKTLSSDARAGKEASEDCQQDR